MTDKGILRKWYERKCMRVVITESDFQELVDEIKAAAWELNEGGDVVSSYKLFGDDD